MPNPIAGRDYPISQYLRATRKILQDVVFNAKCVWSVNMSRQRTDTYVCRMAATLVDAAEVERTSQMDVWIVADIWRVLG